MIDVESEEILPLSVAARNVRGGKVHVSTLYRWVFKGVRGVTLETLMRGGVRFTSREALTRFFERVTAVANGDAPQARTVSQRARAISRAETALAKSGI